MLTLTLGTWLVNLLVALFILVCVFLVLVILIQKPKGGGLSGAFGGAGSGGAVFGSKAGDALTWFTVAAFGCFLLLAIALVYATRDNGTAVGTDDRVIEETAPAGAGASPQEQPVAPEGEQGEEPLPDIDEFEDLDGTVPESLLDEDTELEDDQIPPLQQDGQ